MHQGLIISERMGASLVILGTEAMVHQTLMEPILQVLVVWDYQTNGKGATTIIVSDELPSFFVNDSETRLN